MRKLVFFISAITILASCGSDEAYPIVFNYDKSEITESTIYTIDESGNDVFPDQILPLTDINVSQEELFAQATPPFPIRKITLLTETTLRVEFDQNLVPIEPTEYSYSLNQENLIPEFGIKMEDEKVYGQACLSINAQTIPYIVEFNADFCSAENAVEACKSLFDQKMFGVGDTLALSIQRYIFRKE
ncbi:MAG: hypothetical protein P1U56_11965 [Saprospiraceae bacterium]|nr:hypothetical protein [Saprospiraceae bacterium]